MRLTVAVVTTAVLAGMAAAQLAMGPHGVSTPPINLVQVFNVAREMLSHLFSNVDQVEAKDVSSGSNRINDKMKVINDKTDIKCLPGEDCWAWLDKFTYEGTKYPYISINGDDNTDQENGNGDGSDGSDGGNGNGDGEDGGDGEDDGGEDEESSTDSPDYLDALESKYVVVKWVMAYVGFIITCAILIVIISVPYLITGQTFRSLDSGLVPPIDQEDTLLLLTWLLGETSGDESCLNRVVCLNPERSARYLAIPKVISSSLYRFVPVRYQEQLRRLEEVTDNGLQHSCQQYLCPVLPEL